MNKKSLMTQANASIKPIEGEWLTELNQLPDEDLQQIVGGSQVHVEAGIVSISADNSVNISSNIFGNSINTGVGNVITSISNLTGVIDGLLV